MSSSPCHKEVFIFLHIQVSSLYITFSWGVIIVSLVVGVSEWVIIALKLKASEQFFSYIMARTSYISFDDVRFVLDQHAELDFYSAGSL